MSIPDVLSALRKDLPPLRFFLRYFAPLTLLRKSFCNCKVNLEKILSMYYAQLLVKPVDEFLIKLASSEQHCLLYHFSFCFKLSSGEIGQACTSHWAICNFSANGKCLLCFHLL